MQDSIGRNEGVMPFVDCHLKEEISYTIIIICKQTIFHRDAVYIIIIVICKPTKNEPFSWHGRL